MNEGLSDRSKRSRLRESQGETTRERPFWSTPVQPVWARSRQSRFYKAAVHPCASTQLGISSSVLEPQPFVDFKTSPHVEIASHFV